MSRDLDVETLRLLVAIGDAGSINQAALARGVSQPAASARLREFEARWRLAVVRRSATGSQLTADGEVIVSWARSLLHKVDTMRSAIEALRQERNSGLSVAASLTVAEQLLPSWLGQLHLAQPRVQPVLQVINSVSVIAAVASGAAELGFIECITTPADLASKVVGHDRLSVVVTPSHRWAKTSTAPSLEELRQERWVVREEGSGTRDTFEQALGITPLIALESTSTASLVGAAIAGVAPAVLSPLSVRGDIKAGRLVPVATDLDLRRPLTAIWRTQERLSAPASQLVAIAREAS